MSSQPLKQLNHVFGYFIEVSNSYKQMVPETYIRKQTLTSGERYITQELKELENKILGAHERLIALEHRLFAELLEKIGGQLDRIQEAIALKRRISFVYFKYDAAKRKALQHNGERYIETPVQLVYAEGYYYLVVFNEKHDDFANYRVDRMDRIEVLDEPALKNERIATFDARELESRAFGMYSGDPVAATLLVDEEVMGAVIDRFGKDVESVPTGEKQARVYATVMKSPVLFGWLAQFGGRVRIEKPTALAQEYRAYLEDIVAAYE